MATAAEKSLPDGAIDLPAKMRPLIIRQEGGVSENNIIGGIVQELCSLLSVLLHVKLLCCSGCLPNRLFKILVCQLS